MWWFSSPNRRVRTTGVLLTVVLVLTACGSTDALNFSQAPGFDAWRAAYPPSAAVPGPAARALLQRYRPRFFLAAESTAPIAFYRDYVTHGRLLGADDQILAEHVDRAALNRVKHRPRVVFAHRPTPATGAPVVFGRVDHDRLPGRPNGRRFIFLTYNLVFPVSGLPIGMPWWLEWLARLGGDPADWHQLDHYTAVTIALAPHITGPPVPVAATIQQHNYLRTYLLGESGAPGVLKLPADNRLRVDIAVRSNELYPHAPGRRRHRAVDFLDPETARYLIAGVDPPWLRADDVTDPVRQVDYRLAFLPKTDAFYVFEGWLGGKRWLPGRDGPPGADYNTAPAFKPKATQMVVFYWHENSRAYPKRLHRLFEADPQAADFEPFVAIFLEDLAQLHPDTAANKSDDDPVSTRHAG